MMGQQVLTLGLSCDKGFVPLVSELFISQTKAIELHEPFDDGRSIAAKRYRTVQQGTKPEMVNAMVKRALNVEIMADYTSDGRLVLHQGDDMLSPRNRLGSCASNEEKHHEIPA